MVTFHISCYYVLCQWSYVNLLKLVLPVSCVAPIALKCTWKAWVDFTSRHLADLATASKRCFIQWHSMGIQFYSIFWNGTIITYLRRINSDLGNKSQLFPLHWVLIYHSSNLPLCKVIWRSSFSKSVTKSISFVHYRGSFDPFSNQIVYALFTILRFTLWDF